MLLDINTNKYPRLYAYRYNRGYESSTKKKTAKQITYFSHQIMLSFLKFILLM